MMSTDEQHLLIGVLSDSHGNVDATRAGVQALSEHGAGMFIHLGDVETEAVIDELVGHDAHIVFGNCDYNIDGLTRHARCMEVTVAHPIGRKSVAGKTIAFTHGHLPNLMKQPVDERVTYLLHGHSHEVRDEVIGTTRVINPGALFRAARYTVALLDPVNDEVKWIEIDKAARPERRSVDRRSGQI